MRTRFLKYNFTLNSIERHVSLMCNVRKLEWIIRNASETMSKSTVKQSAFLTSNTLFTSYIRFCWIATFSIIMLALVENEAFDYHCINVNKIILNSSSSHFDQILTLYEGRQQFGAPNFPISVPWKHITTLGFILGSKATLIRWYLGDIYAILMCRLMTLTLKSYKYEVKEAIEAINQKQCETPKIILEVIRTKYLQISVLLEEMSKFISPLVLSCLWINLYLLVTNVSG